MAVARNEVLKEDQWNLDVLYPDLAAWEKDYEQTVPGQGKPLWPSIAAYKGKIGEGAETLKSFLEETFALSRKLHVLYVYAHLRHDEETTDNESKVAYNKILKAVHDFAEEMSWFEPELLALDEETLSKLLADPVIAPYRFHVEKIIRVKKHMLSQQEEQLIAMSAQALDAANKAFRALSDADFKFGLVKDSEEEEHELTHGSYAIFLRSHDRTLRENAFKQLHGKYKTYENTLCELLNGQVQSHVFQAKARHYSSALEAALFPKNIDVDVYHSLVTAVNENLDKLHRYIDLREKIMDVGRLHLYDMYVPLMTAVDIQMSYAEAEEIVIESVAPLGKEYQDILRQGLKEHRWVDRYENQNKRSGAYSSGCYDSMPYILMNYKGILRDVFTLAHEAGHSMHSHLSHTCQPYQYGDYPIFLAEVASTFHEDLLMRLMLDRVKTKEERAYLINEKIEDIRGTLFRQTMFAEFELKIHQLVEEGIPLTPRRLHDEFETLNKRYFGKRVVIDPEAVAEWSRIPHFYYNFYVYQYATGISAALALSEKVMSGGEAEREAYLGFLKSGSSRYPIDILAAAGVDMRSPEPVTSAINKFGNLVDQLEKELGVN